MGQINKFSYWINRLNESDGNADKVMKAFPVDTNKWGTMEATKNVQEFYTDQLADYLKEKMSELSANLTVTFSVEYNSQQETVEIYDETNPKVMFVTQGVTLAELDQEMSGIYPNTLFTYMGYVQDVSRYYETSEAEDFSLAAFIVSCIQKKPVSSIYQRLPSEIATLVAQVAYSYETRKPANASEIRALAATGKVVLSTPATNLDLNRPATQAPQAPQAPQDSKLLMTQQSSQPVVQTTQAEKRTAASGDWVRVIDVSKVSVVISPDKNRLKINEWRSMGYKNFVNLSFWDSDGYPVGKLFINSVDVGRKKHESWPVLSLFPTLGEYKGGAIVTGFAGSNVLVKDGKELQQSNSDRAKASRPRTGVGVTRDRKVIVVISKSATMQEFASKCATAGADFAINMDGGGSTLFVEDGKTVFGSTRSSVPVILAW